jgi:protein farnesyltransferase/geranylgeranyltransferase type-1 subunit alpha
MTATATATPAAAESSPLSAPENWADHLYAVKTDADWEFGEVFEDVAPVPQNDGPEPVCSIAYKPSFERAMNYFRAVIRLKEYSPRAFQLTSICLKHNPSNYTVWHYRRICLTDLCRGSTGNNGDMDGNNTSTGTNVSRAAIIDPTLVELDLEFAAQLGGANPKNYQVWYHRRALLESMLLQQNGVQKNGTDDETSSKDDNDVNNNSLSVSDMVKKELSYIASVLKADAKNYHVSYFSEL